jgi:hypothetical protein
MLSPQTNKEIYSYETFIRCTISFTVARLGFQHTRIAAANNGMRHFWIAKFAQLGATAR